MEVKITDYGPSKGSKKYFITYKVSDINNNWLNKLKNLIEDDHEVKDGEIHITVYFDEKYYPLGSDEFNYKKDDFIAREELEMTAYLLSILEE